MTVDKKKSDPSLVSKRKSPAKSRRVKLLEFQVLPLRDVVVYPEMVIPLFVGREYSVKSIEQAMTLDQDLVLVSQKDSEQEEPVVDNFYAFGTLCSILQLMRLPDGTLKVLVEGSSRVKVKEFIDMGDSYRARVLIQSDDLSKKKLFEPLKRSLSVQFEQYIKLNKKVPPEVLSSVLSITQASRLVDTIAAHVSLKIQDRQTLLETLDVARRAEVLMGFVEREIDLLKMEKRIRVRVQDQMTKNQREYYLSEQMKAIQQELGDDEASDSDALKKKIKAAKMSKEASNKCLSELKKIKSMSPMSAEATVSRNYIDTMLDFPWNKKTALKHNLSKAAQILDEDHYGLEKVKERMLEYLAVQERTKKMKGPILVFVGPPGVGKTSLGSSIAKAVGRKFVRLSLGGVRDEAEIRGHRRTYIGSMPGNIVQKIIKSKVKNPLFMLDEIDKMAADFRGDPSSALLEVLDPEQNFSFNDHYLEVDIDLSDVMFIATANSMNIPPALLDRMEVIRLAGYTEHEKMNIARRHLLPKQIKQTGLKKTEFKINDKAILDIIRYYTRESGVRNLERDLSKLCQKTLKKILTTPSTKKLSVTPKTLEGFLGVKKFRFGIADIEDQIGQVTGLAWTEVGGELLKIEAMIVPGKGKVEITGQLGEVMQESIKAAITVVRGYSKPLEIAENFYQKNDIHIHVPEGATPKDGPSAGVGMCTALVSSLTKIAVRADVAMTGEITLRGEVLPIGGLKEKILAALRGGIKLVLIPLENEPDLKEIPKEIREAIKIKPVHWINEVLNEALVTPVNLKKLANKGRPKKK